ncbi:MAG: hypothetical protein KF894_12495 [Labilithrix sp.]|nr:hypothetical protein [Labilithrix sp.]
MMTSRLSLLFIGSLLFACGGSSPPPAAPAAPSEPATASETPPPSGSSDGSSALTAEACQAAGGQVVGDIGDGAIHRPGYRCAGSGEPPIGKITPPPGGPIPIEGSVCCK